MAWVDDSPAKYFRRAKPSAVVYITSAEVSTLSIRMRGANTQTTESSLCFESTGSQRYNSHFFVVDVQHRIPIQDCIPTVPVFMVYFLLPRIITHSAQKQPPLPKVIVLVGVVLGFIGGRLSL